MNRQITDLAYNESQRLDLYLVEQPGQPLVVCLHGGGFWSGNKDDRRCIQSAKLLNEAGFNCASISYSLATAENRFSMWPRNLFDIADALVFLHKHSEEHGYDFSHPGMLGFSAGCCLSNLYIQGGKNIFSHFGYQTQLFEAAALAGFYGPYDFSIRQAERRSDNPEINLYHSPSYWIRQNTGKTAAPVLHIQGDHDSVVYPDQHAAFQKDYMERGFDFKAVIVEGFGHSFAPVDSNASGESIDFRSELSDFFSSHLTHSTT
jgi:acetyl esterase/lipase